MGGEILDALIEELKELMAEKNLKASHIARIIGTYNSTVHHWLTGFTNPSGLYRDAVKKAIRKIRSMNRLPPFV